MPDSNASVPNPTVVLSYLSDDYSWREEFLSQLSPYVVNEVWDDKIYSDSTGIPFNRHTGAVLEKAAALVVLISPLYIRSSWVAQPEHQNYLIDLEERGLQVFPVLLTQVDREDLERFSRWTLFPGDGRSMSDLSSQDRDLRFAELATTIVSIVVGSQSESDPSKEPDTPAVDYDDVDPTESDESPADKRISIEELSQFRLSRETEEVLLRARLLTGLTGEGKRITTSGLLFGLAETGREDVGYIKTPQFFFKELIQNGEESYKNEFVINFPVVDYPLESNPLETNPDIALSQFIKPDVLHVFTLAQKISLQTYQPSKTRASKTRKAKTGPAPPEGQIGARHLLAALLTIAPSFQAGATLILSRMLTDPGGLRKSFFKFIKSNLPDDDHNAWRRILIDLE